MEGIGETNYIVNNVSSGVNLKDKLVNSRTLGVIMFFVFSHPDFNLEKLSRWQQVAKV